MSLDHVQGWLIAVPWPSLLGQLVLMRDALKKAVSFLDQPSRTFLLICRSKRRKSYSYCTRGVSKRETGVAYLHDPFGQRFGYGVQQLDFAARRTIAAADVARDGFAQRFQVTGAEYFSCNIRIQMISQAPQRCANRSDFAMVRTGLTMDPDRFNHSSTTVRNGLDRFNHSSTMVRNGFDRFNHSS